MYQYENYFSPLSFTWLYLPEVQRSNWQNTDCIDRTVKQTFWTLARSICHVAYS